ncbi:hypothetical protein FBQ95_10950 [Chloroflexi bacterium CFX3]|nr:hypothetical protein [Chloroflexi bacterium CFX3]
MTLLPQRRMRAYTYSFLIALAMFTLFSRWVVNGQPPPTALPEGLRGKLAFTKALSGGAMPLHLMTFTAQPRTEQPLAADLRCDAEAISCVHSKPAWSPDGRALAYLEGSAQQPTIHLGHDR